MSHPWQRWNQTGSAQVRPRSSRSRITTQVKIGMPVCFIYVIQQSLLQSLLLEKVRPDSASKVSPMHNSAKKTLCWTSFDERTETYVFVGVIYWGSRRSETDTEFGSAARHVFFCKCVMDEPGNRCRNECFAPACVQEIDSGQQFPTTAEQSKWLSKKI
jgi:hypothetical protein